MEVPDDQSIEFHVEEGGHELPSSSVSSLAGWVVRIIHERGRAVGPVNYIFCGDDYLHKMNVEYLDHDTLTDIITFPYETFPIVSGDLFISTERVSENAVGLGSSYEDELHRVMIHGILHLCGQGDKSTAEAKEMRNLEDWALSLRPDFFDK